LIIYNLQYHYKDMAIFGLESSDVAVLGLLFGIMSAILGPLTYFLINISKRMAIRGNYIEAHETKSNKEAEVLDKVVIKLAVLETRFKVLERMLANGNRSGAMGLGEDTSGD